MSVVASDPAVQPLLAEMQATIQAVVARLSRGDIEGGARQFVEEVALGPGAWEQLPEPIRATMIDSAPAFIAEQRDPTWAGVDLAALARIECPVLLTQGDQSPRWFLEIVAKLAPEIDRGKVLTYGGAGHAPHITHPNDYVAATTAFLASSRERALVP
jgi:pimeloyl-ACP methyl ester carboxylesterase